MALFLNFILPVFLVWYCGESFTVAWNGNIFRYLLGLHLVWCINSVCHIWGHRPFDKNITPTDSHFMGFIGFGEFFLVI
jgi:stearoyl-CoA desaturase (Delta-9 desaturase)